MAGISELELRGILQAARSDAMSANRANQLSVDREKAMRYYLGDVSQDIASLDGRSQIVSTDVSDTIEGLMPVLMEVFAGGDETVKFEPVGPEDTQAAEQETDYVNHVFLQKNPGFLVLYTMIKDALLSKVGVVKVWWQEEERETRETYENLDESQYQGIIASPDIEIIEQTIKNAPDDGDDGAPDTLPGMMPGQLPPKFYDVTVCIKKKVQCAKVMGVPPEEFGIASTARSVPDCGYCSHSTARKQSDLIDEGYDEEAINRLPNYRPHSLTPEEQARDTVQESYQIGDTGANKANRQLLITEHYIKMDYEGDGKAAIYRITTGEDYKPLAREGEDDVTRVDFYPFAAMTPVIMTHRFWGRSIADLVMDIQRIKTVLVRALLDNQYQRNNFRTEIADSHTNENTIADLLITRPGGIVRTKQPGGLNPLVVEDISPAIYPALQYFDATREWRTGVSRQGQGVDPNALQNQVATIANQMEQMSDKKLKLIARIFAETGIRDLFSLLHATIRKHGSRAQTVRLRNRWVEVDPREWKQRDDMTIQVGLGTGNKAQQLAGIQMIIGAQQQAVAAGLVSKDGLWHTAQALTRVLGFPDAGHFFVDPGKPPDPQNPNAAALPPPPDPKQGEIAAKAQAEQAKIQADAAHQQMKTQADIHFQNEKARIDTQLAHNKEQSAAQLAQQKFELDRQTAIMKAQLEERTAAHTMAMKERELHMKAESDQRSHTLALGTANAKTKIIKNGATIKDDGSMDLHPHLADALSQLAQGIAQSHHEIMKAVSAPRRTDVHRDPKTRRVTHATSKLETPGSGTLQ